VWRVKLGPLARLEPQEPLVRRVTLGLQEPPVWLVKLGPLARLEPQEPLEPLERRVTLVWRVKLGPLARLEPPEPPEPLGLQEPPE
jgi:hypothetical protein